MANPTQSNSNYPNNYEDAGTGIWPEANSGDPFTVTLSRRVRNSIVAIEKELGLNPSGSYTTVTDRFSYIETVLSIHNHASLIHTDIFEDFYFSYSLANNAWITGNNAGGTLADLKTKNIISNKVVFDTNNAFIQVDDAQGSMFFDKVSVFGGYVFMSNNNVAFAIDYTGAVSTGRWESTPIEPQFIDVSSFSNNAFLKVFDGTLGAAVFDAFGGLAINHGEDGISLSVASGYAIPTDAQINNWNTVYGNNHPVNQDTGTTSDSFVINSDGDNSSLLFGQQSDAEFTRGSLIYDRPTGVFTFSADYAVSTVIAGLFSGSGAGLNNLNAEYLINTVSDARLSSLAQDAIAKRHAPNQDTGTTAGYFVVNSSHTSGPEQFGGIRFGSSLNAPMIDLYFGHFYFSHKIEAPQFEGNLAASFLTGTVPITKGGTGITSVGANNTILTSNGSGLVYKVFNNTNFAHTHPQSDITNLVTDLSNKAPLSHTHTKSQITDFSHTHPLSQITDAGTAASKNVPNIGVNALVSQVVMGDDTRLTNARTPTSHIHQIEDIGKINIEPQDLADGQTFRYDSGAGEWYATFLSISDIDGLSLVLGDKEPTIAAGTTSQYWRGDKTWQPLNKEAVQLGNVNNTSDLDKPISTATLAALVNKSDVSHTHTIADVSGLQAALNGKASSSHTHVKANITDFAHTHPQSDITNLVTDLSNKASLSHTHTKSQITDFAHGHPQSEITNLVNDLAGKAASVHTHTKSQITDFAHTHVKADITDFAHTHVLANITDAGTAASKNAPATGVNATTAQVVMGDDTRLTNARTPLSHTHTKSQITDFAHGHPQSEITNLVNDLAGKAATSHTHTKSQITDFAHTHVKADITDFAHTHVLANITDAGTAASKNAPATGNATTTQVVMGNDTRLTDSRTPTTHTHTKSQITDFAHTHVKADITDFAHTHLKVDVIGLNDDLNSIYTQVGTLQDAIDTHTNLTNNPHNVTKAQIGLGDVNNTSDLNKPISTDTQNALNLKINISAIGVANGVASLDSGGKVPANLLPAIAITETFTVASQSAQVALNAQAGDIAIRTDENRTYIHNGGAEGNFADWTLLSTPTDVVLSVNSLTGHVVLNAASVGAAPASHTHPQSAITNLVTDLSNKAPLNHTHTKADITDFAHTHLLADITGLGTAASRNVSASGNASVSEVVLGNDSRLSDARTPLAHNQSATTITTGTLVTARGGTGLTGFSKIGNMLYASSTSALAVITSNHSTTRMFLRQSGNGSTATAPAWDSISNTDISGLGTASTKNVPASNNASSTEVVLGNDTRLTDARTPTEHTHLKSQITDFSHTHPQSDITNLSTDLAGKAPLSHTHTKAQITDWSHSHSVTDITGILPPSKGGTGYGIAPTENQILIGTGSGNYIPLNLTGQSGLTIGVSPYSVIVTPATGYVIPTTAQIGQLHDKNTDTGTTASSFTIDTDDNAAIVALLLSDGFDISWTRSTGALHIGGANTGAISFESGLVSLGALSAGSVSSSTGTFTGAVTASSFSGSGASLTSLPAAQLTGTVPEARLPTAINATKIANGTVDNTEFQYLNGVTSAIQTQLDGKLTQVAGYVSGVTMGDSKLDFYNGDSEFYDWGRIAYDEPNRRFTLTSLSYGDANLTLGGTLTAGNFSGSGSGLTALNASQLTSGTVPEARLPTAINATKIANGTVDNTEFQYLNGVTSAIQTQLNGKAASSHSHTIAQVTNLQTNLNAKANLAGANTFSGINTFSSQLNVNDNPVKIANGDGSGAFTKPSITFAWPSGGFENYIHSRHQGSSTAGNALDFYTNNGAFGGTIANAVHGLTVTDGKVGIGGITSPTVSLDVNGDIKANNINISGQLSLGGMVVSYKSIASNYTVLTSDYYLHVAAAYGPFTITMPQNAPVGQVYKFYIDPANVSPVITWDAGSGGFMSMAYVVYDRYATLPVNERRRVYEMIQIASKIWVITTYW